MIRFTAFAALITCAITPYPAAAQTTHDLRPGGRIGVFAPSVSDQTTMGRLDAIDANSLRLTLADGETVTFARNDVARLYVFTGMRSHTFKGMGIGALTGFALGATMVIIGSSGDSDSIDSIDRAVYTVAMVETTAGGALVGSILGAVTRTEKWREISPSNVRWGIAPTLDGGVKVAFALRF